MAGDNPLDHSDLEGTNNQHVVNVQRNLRCDFIIAWEKHLYHNL